jgi:hypothetical protein
VGILAEEKIQR